MTLRITLIILAAILIAAHFLRSGSVILVGLSLLAPCLFFVRRRWSLLVLQGLAYLAALIWLRAAVQLVVQRLALGRSWVGVVVILGSVALLTILAGWLLNSEGMQKKYPP